MEVCAGGGPARGAWGTFIVCPKNHLLFGKKPTALPHKHHSSPPPRCVLLALFAAAIVAVLPYHTCLDKDSYVGPVEDEVIFETAANDASSCDILCWQRVVPSPH